MQGTRYDGKRLMTYDKRKIFDEASVEATMEWLDKQIRDAKKKLNKPGMRDMPNDEFQKLSIDLEMIFARNHTVWDVNSSKVISVNETLKRLIEYIVKLENKLENKIESMKTCYGGSWVALREGETLDDVFDSLEK